MTNDGVLYCDEESQARFGKIKRSLGLSLEPAGDPVLQTVRSLTNIINDLSEDNKRLREDNAAARAQYDHLMTTYAHMVKVSARLAGIPQTLMEDVSDHELAAFRSSAEAVTNKVSKRSKKEDPDEIPRDDSISF